MELWVFIAAGSVFVFAIVVYVLFMIFLPEWVGITGKVAIEAEKSHSSGEKAEDDDLLSRLQKRPSKNP